MTPTHWFDWRPTRAASDVVLTGTAAGLAGSLGVGPLVVRVSFVVLGIAGGLGVVFYVALYLATLANDPTDDPRALADLTRADASERVLGVGLITLGLLLAIRATWPGFIDSIVWPVAALATGFVIAVERGRVNLGEFVMGSDSRRTSPTVVAVRVLGGLGLTIGGLVALLALNFDFDAVNNVVFATIAIAAGLGIVLGPWIRSVTADLIDERRNRIRSEEKAELAAHLHDSVLQTLSLIQRSADDPARMAQLARRQERELRSWLHGDGRLGHSDRLREGLETAAAAVEDDHGVPIDVVVVGDRPADERIDGLLAAAREAMHNAARHSGTSRIDVFAEVGADAVQVFVRDTGCGYDQASVPADRRGVSESIRGRMRRLGGAATVITAPGEGTEVELELPLTAADLAESEETG
ncbi:MAG: PspC domain-containing protein [Acidimicrobiales bacterium]